MNKYKIRNTSQKQGSRKTMRSYVAENSKNADKKSSRVLKQTINMPNEEMSNMKNVPVKRIPERAKSSKSFESYKEKNKRNVFYDNTDQKQTEPTSSVRQNNENTLLHMIKNKQSVIDVGKKIMKSNEHKRHQESITMHLPYKNKRMKSHEHKIHHEDKSHEENNNCNRKHGSCHRDKNSNTVKKRVLSKVFSIKVHFNFKGATKKRSHKISSHTRHMHYSNNTKKSVDSFKKTSDSFRVEKSFPEQLSETEPAHNGYYYDKYGVECCTISPETSSEIFKKMETLFFGEDVGEVCDNQGINKCDQSPLNNCILVSREPCSILGDTSQAVSDTDTYEIRFEGNNNQNNIMPLNPESQGFSGQKEIQNTCSSDVTENHYNVESVHQQHSQVTENYYNIESVHQQHSDVIENHYNVESVHQQHSHVTENYYNVESAHQQHSDVIENHYNVESVHEQPMLSPGEMSDLISPRETSYLNMTDLNRGCITHGQSSGGQYATTNYASSHQLTGTMLSSDEPLDLSKSEASYYSSLWTLKQRNESSITRNEADTRNSNEITRLSGTAFYTSDVPERNSDVRIGVNNLANSTDDNYKRDSKWLWYKLPTE